MKDYRIFDDLIGGDGRRRVAELISQLAIAAVSSSFSSASNSGMKTEHQPPSINALQAIDVSGLIHIALAVPHAATPVTARAIASQRTSLAGPP